MIRTLAIVAAVGFVLSVACFAGAIAIAGGPFSIDDNWRFHRAALPQEPSSVQRVFIRNAVRT